MPSQSSRGRMPGRIVLALDRADLDGRAIVPLLRLAASADAALEAVLLEDARLVRITHTPGTRFVHTMGHEEREIPPETMRLAVAARARRVRQRLEQFEALRGRTFDLRESPCERLVDAFSETSHRDLIVVSRRTDGGNTGEVEQLLRGTWPTLGASTLIINPVRPPDCSVVVLVEGKAPELGLAAHLASHFECRLEVITVGGQDDGKLAEPVFESHDPQVENVRVHRADANNPKALVARIASLRPGTLLLEQGGALAHSLDLGELMSASRASLYLHAADP